MSSVKKSLRFPSGFCSIFLFRVTFIRRSSVIPLWTICFYQVSIKSSQSVCKRCTLHSCKNKLQWLFSHQVFLCIAFVVFIALHRWNKRNVDQKYVSADCREYTLFKLLKRHDLWNMIFYCRKEKEKKITMNFLSSTLFMFRKIEFIIVRHIFGEDEKEKLKNSFLPLVKLNKVRLVHAVK